MKLSKIFRIKKPRKYPIKRDGEGRSLRARCFELFERGKRPVEVARELNMDEPTACRYYRDWKRLGPNFERLYAYVQSLLGKTAPDREKNIELFARSCGISKKEFEDILSRPHGLRRFLTGKFHFPIHIDADHKRYIALELALLISDHLIKHKGKFVDIYFALKRYMHEAKKFREERDAAEKKENIFIAFVHQIIAKDMENERRGRVKSDTLSEEERHIIIKWVLEAEEKEAEIYYSTQIGHLMADGITMEQAREKIHQDFLEKGDLKRAKMIREFQDKVHPLKTNGQITPPSTPQPPSPT